MLMFLSISLKIEGSNELFFSDFRDGIGLRFSGISDFFQSYGQPAGSKKLNNTSRCDLYRI